VVALAVSISPLLLNKKPGVGHPLAFTVQFYQIDPRLWKPDSFQCESHLNNRIAIRKNKCVHAAHVGKLLSGRITYLHEK
jgi:hypothetical protein